MNEQLIQLTRRVEALERENMLLRNASTIPLDIDQSFRKRFLTTYSSIASNSKSVTSENQAVDEGGSATYSVLKPPDGFAVTQLADTGSTIYLPYFT